MDQSSQAANGTLEAPDQAEAIRLLAQRNIFVTQIDPVDGAASPSRSGAVGGRTHDYGATSNAPAARRRLSLRARAMLFDQIATATSAGLPLLTALQSVRDQAETDSLKSLLADLTDRVQGGESLSNAMAAHSNDFSPLHISMIRAGETAGVLDEVTTSLADFCHRDMDLREKIRSASIYPMIVLVLAVVSIAVIVTVIVPNILESVEDNPALLPLPTKILLALSTFMQAWWWLILAIIVGATVSFKRWVNTAEGRYKFDATKLRVPIMGAVIRKASVARFARVLGTLIASGIQILEALQVLRDILGNEALARQIDDVAAALTQGQSVAEPLRATGQFPAMFVQVIDLGEKTGRLDEMLLKAADAYDRETATAIDRAMTILPTVMILGLSAVVAFILVSVLLPIINMQSAI